MEGGSWHCTGNKDQDHSQGTKNAKKAKWMTEEALKITVKRWEVKSKGEKEIYTYLNSEFQRIARRDKKAFLSDQCKEIEENNRMGKTRDLLGEGNGTPSSTLAWKIPWTEEPGRLQSMGSLRVGHDWTTSLSLFTFMRWRRKWHPTPVFLPGESQGWGAWWAAIYGVAQSRTQLKRLSSSSSSSRPAL